RPCRGACGEGPTPVQAVTVITLVAVAHSSAPPPTGRRQAVSVTVVSREKLVATLGDRPLTFTLFPFHTQFHRVGLPSDASTRRMLWPALGATGSHVKSATS